MKLWFTIRAGGATDAVAMIRRHVAATQQLAEWVAADGRFEIVAPHPLNLLCLRLKAGNEATDALIAAANETGRALFTRTVLDGVGSTRNPVTLLRVAGAASKGVRVDRDLGLGDLVSLARHLAGATPETVVLPTTPARKGGAAVLLLKEPDAGPVLAGFGANR